MFEGEDKENNRNSSSNNISPILSVPTAPPPPAAVSEDIGTGRGALLGDIQKGIGLKKASARKLKEPPKTQAAQAVEAGGLAGALLSAMQARTVESQPDDSDEVWDDAPLKRDTEEKKARKETVEKVKVKIKEERSAVDEQEQKKVSLRARINRLVATIETLTKGMKSYGVSAGNEHEDLRNLDEDEKDEYLSKKSQRTKAFKDLENEKSELARLSQFTPKPATAGGRDAMLAAIRKKHDSVPPTFDEVEEVKMSEYQPEPVQPVHEMVSPVVGQEVNNQVSSIPTPPPPPPVMFKTPSDAQAKPSQSMSSKSASVVSAPAPQKPVAVDKAVDKKDEIDRLLDNSSVSGKAPAIEESSRSRSNSTSSTMSFTKTAPKNNTFEQKSLVAKRTDALQDLEKFVEGYAKKRQADTTHKKNMHKMRHLFGGVNREEKIKVVKEIKDLIAAVRKDLSQSDDAFIEPFLKALTEDHALNKKSIYGAKQGELSTGILKFLETVKPGFSKSKDNPWHHPKKDKKHKA
jgi:hypothetical protein